MQIEGNDLPKAESVQGLSQIDCLTTHKSESDPK